MAIETDPSVWWTVGPWLAGALGIGGLIGWFLREILKQFLPTPRWLERRLRNWRGEVPRAKGTHFTVLIADLDGDTDGAQTRHVEAALRGYDGLDVILVGPGPRTFDLGSRAEAQLAAEDQGRALLERQDGDVLIFGEVAEANTRLRLRFLPGHPGVEGHHASYQLQAADLPADFGTDFNAVLLALVGASVAPATEQAGTYLVDLLRPVADKLRQLLAHLPPGLDSDQGASLAHAFALAASLLGEQAGESAWLEEAVAAYRAALEVLTRERAPLHWATTQNNLGNALSRLGEREEGTTRLNEAVDAYRAALNVFRLAGAAFYIEITEANLARAEALQAEQQGGASAAE